MRFVPKKKQANMRRLMDLPEEILLEIFKRLPVKSVYCIRCVSKTLFHIASSPFFVSRYSLQLISTNAAADEPQLLLHKKERLFLSARKSDELMTETALQSLIYDASKRKVTLFDILYSSNNFSSGSGCYTIPFAFYNLVCILHGRSCFLIDAFRGEVLRIPTSGLTELRKHSFVDSVEDYGMGFDYITSTYKIVRLSIVRYESYDNYVVAQVHVLGTSSWHETPSPFGPFYSLNLITSMSVCAYGDAHWLLHSKKNITEGERREELNRILSFDFTKEEFYITPYPPTLPNSESALKYLKLITLKGSLAIVDSSSVTKIDIWMMKDYNKKEWMLEYTIIFQMFEPKLQTNDRETTDYGEWENGIFFVWEGTTFFFDLGHVPMNWVKCRNNGENTCFLTYLRTFSLKMSLISLKCFGDLIQESGSKSLRHFSKKFLT